MCLLHTRGPNFRYFCICALEFHFISRAIYPATFPLGLPKTSIPEMWRMIFVWNSCFQCRRNLMVRREPISNLAFNYNVLCWNREWWTLPIFSSFHGSADTFFLARWSRRRNVSFSFRLSFQETLSPELLSISQLLFPNSSSCNLPCRNSIPLSHFPPISQEEFPNRLFRSEFLLSFLFAQTHTWGSNLLFLFRHLL